MNVSNHAPVPAQIKAPKSNAAPQPLGSAAENAGDESFESLLLKAMRMPVQTGENLGLEFIDTLNVETAVLAITNEGEIELNLLDKIDPGDVNLDLEVLSETIPDEPIVTETIFEVSFDSESVLETDAEAPIHEVLMDETPIDEIPIHIEEMALDASADRFDMTGVLGHAKAVEWQEFKLAQTKNAPRDGRDSEEITTTNISEGLKAKPQNKQARSAKSSIGAVRASHRAMPVAVPKASSSISLQSQNIQEGDGIESPADLAEGIEDGADLLNKEAAKSSAKSILNTLSSQAQTNPVFVALSTLENGLKLIARVQNMTEADQMHLSETVRSYLAENGFTSVDIVIDSFHAKQNRQAGGG